MGNKIKVGAICEVLRFSTEPSSVVPVPIADAVDVRIFVNGHSFPGRSYRVEDLDMHSHLQSALAGAIGRIAQAVYAQGAFAPEALEAAVRLSKQIESGDSGAEWSVPEGEWPELWREYGDVPA